MTKKTKKPFADTSTPKKADGSEARRLADRRAAFSRLVANEDFKEWMFSTLFTLCAFENDLRNTTEFERGIRASGSLVRRELLIADGASEFFADLNRRYYEGVRRGILDASKNHNENNEGIA